MGFLDKLFGRDERSQPQQPQQWAPPAPGQQPVGRQDAGPGQAGSGASEDERAIARYRYLLRTAPPEQVEQAHAEAFAQLTPEQRRQVLDRLTRELPHGEAPTGDDPQTLARAATRAEMSRPGTMQRSFGGGGMGSMVAGSMLGTIAGVVIGSAVAQSLFGGFQDSPEAGEVGEGSGGEGEAADAGGQDGGGQDPGAGEDVAGGDADFGGGDFGGDVGGGDFGGDFGGGFGGDF